MPYEQVYTKAELEEAYMTGYKKGVMAQFHISNMVQASLAKLIESSGHVNNIKVNPEYDNFLELVHKLSEHIRDIP